MAHKTQVNMSRAEKTIKRQKCYKEKGKKINKNKAIDLSIYHFDPNEDNFASISQTALKCYMDVHGPQKMDPDNQKLTNSVLF